MLNLEDCLFSPYMHTHKTQRETNSMCMCLTECVSVCMCMLIKGFQRRKLHSYKFITAAKLIVSSDKNQLEETNKQTTTKTLKSICCKMLCQMLLTMMVQVF